MNEYPFIGFTFVSNVETTTDVTIDRAHFSKSEAQFFANLPEHLKLSYLQTLIEGKDLINRNLASINPYSTSSRHRFIGETNVWSG